MDSKKVLFISTQLPFPPKSGGTVKSWNYVNFLSKVYSLSIACLLKDDDEEHTEDFEKAIELENFWSENSTVSRSAINLCKSYFCAPCLNAFRNYSKTFKNKIDSIANDFELIIVDHYEVFQYVPDSFKGKIVMHTHNAEFMLWSRLSELTSNPIKKLTLRIEANRVKSYEREIIEKSDLVFSTPSDIELYKKQGFDVSKHQITYHLGNDTFLKLPDLQFANTEKALTFIGTLSWEPNIDGIIWFLNNCWPQIKSKHPDCKVYILGSSANNRIVTAAKNDPQIIFTGFVQNLDDYLQKTRVYIAPLRFGSGMKVKVLEGLYRGTPTVTTSVGAEGLDINSESEVLIADECDLYAEQCLRLLENEPLWNKLRDNSRKVAKEKYRWAPMFEKMNIETQKLFG